MVDASTTLRSKAVYTKPSQAPEPLPRSGFVHGGAKRPAIARLAEVAFRLQSYIRRTVLSLASIVGLPFIVAWDFS